MTPPAAEGRLKEATQRVVETATRKGADTAVATMTQKSAFQVEVRNGEIENLAEADGQGITLTVSKDHRRATVTSCDFSEASIELLVEQALDMCRYTDQDTYYRLPDEELLARENQDLDLYDPKVLELDVKEKIRMVKELEQKLLAQDKALRPDGTGLNTVTGTGVLANSQGFCMSKVYTMIDIGTSAFAEDKVAAGDLNTGRKQVGGFSSRSRYTEDLLPLEDIAEKAAYRVLRKLGGRKPKTGHFPIYFEPSMARGLWAHFLGAASGTPIYRHESYLEGKLDQMVASPCISIHDDPKILRGLGSRVFDAEGVACHRQTLIDKGRLNTYLMGSYSSRKLGLRSTGHAGGSTNVLIDPGDCDEAELLRRMGTGVWVTSLLGQGVNQSTGDYSRGASGLWVENGEVLYPVMEFTLNSNLDHMYKNIVHLGNNVETGYSVQTPGFVVGEMTISGV